MNHVLPWLACLGMTMYQFHAAQSIQLMLKSKFLPEQLHLAAVGYCLGIFSGCVAVLVTTMRGYGSGNVPSGATGKRFIFIIVLTLAAAAVRLYLFDEWQGPAARAALQMGSGFLLVMAHWIFFTLVQKRHQASLYCGAPATGFALAGIHYRIVFAGIEMAGAPVLLHRTLIFTTVVYALILGSVIWMLTRSKTAEHDYGDEGAGSLRTTGSLVLLLVLLYLLHGMVDGSFLPFHTASRFQANRALTTALTVVFLGSGIWLFRKGVAWAFRPLITVCGILHMAMAVFSLFSTDLVVLRSLHVLIGPVQYLFIAMVVCALANTAPQRWRVVAVSIPFALKAAETLFIPLLLRSAIGNSEALPLAAIFVAVAFYAFGRRIELAPYGLPDPIPLDPVILETMAVDGNAAYRKAILELSDRYGFSPRERQVGELLASGMPVDHIGERLGLSTNTVNTYVRRIVLKTGCEGRRGFVAMVQGGSDEQD